MRETLDLLKKENAPKAATFDALVSKTHVSIKESDND